MHDQRPSIPQRLAWPTVVAGLALAVMVYPLSLADTMGYWYDEIWSVDAALGGFGRMLELVAGDVHPPLYHALLWAWVRVFGSGEVATRALSIFALGASVPAAFALARSLGVGRAASAAVAGAVGFAYASATFALETRPYTFLLLTTTLTAWLLVRARTPGLVAAAWAAGLAATGMHYAALFFLLPYSALVAWRERDGRKLLPAAGWLVMLIPFAWLVKSQAIRFAAFTWLVPPRWPQVENYFRYAVGSSEGALITFAVWGAAAALAARRRELFGPRLWLLAAPLVMMAVFAASYLLTPIFHIRYLFAAEPFVFLPAGYLIDRLPHRWARAAAAAALVALVAFGTSRVPLVKSEDWRQAADYVKQHRQGEPVVTTSGARWYRVYFPDLEVIDEADAGAAAAWLADHAGQPFWMLQARNFDATPARRALAAGSDILALEEFYGSRAILLRPFSPPAQSSPAK